MYKVSFSKLILGIGALLIILPNLNLNLNVQAEQQRGSKRVGQECDKTLDCEDQLNCVSHKCVCNYEECCDTLEAWQGGQCRRRAKTECEKDNCVFGAKCVGIDDHYDHNGGGATNTRHLGTCKCFKESDELSHGLCKGGSFRSSGNQAVLITGFMIVGFVTFI